MDQEQKDALDAAAKRAPVSHGPRITREGQIIRLDGEHALTIHLREGTTAHQLLLDILGV